MVDININDFKYLIFRFYIYFKYLIQYGIIYYLVTILPYFVNNFYSLCLSYYFVNDEKYKLFWIFIYLLNYLLTYFTKL